MVSYAMEKNRAREQIRRLESVIGRCKDMEAHNGNVSTDLNCLAGVVESQIRLSGMSSMQVALRNLNNGITNDIQSLLQACNSKKASLERQIANLISLEQQSSEKDS